MKVSIIMPVYNSGKYIQRALGSIAVQTHDNWELIVVDDGSEDESMTIVDAFRQEYIDRCIVVHSARPKSGAGVCRNIGVMKASGDYVLFFDSDDLLEPFCLTQRVEVMRENYFLDWAVFNQYAWYPERKAPFDLYNKRVKSREEAIRYFLQMQSAWQTMAVLWKKQAIEKLQGFDERLYFMEDPDLHLRALLDGELKVGFETERSADCFYKMPVLTNKNTESFYANSIVSRFEFLKKLLQLLPKRVPQQDVRTYNRYIRIGFLDFVKKLLLARLNDYKQQFSEMLKLLTKKNVLSDADNLRLQIAASAYSSRSKVVSALKLRGLAYRLL